MASPTASLLASPPVPGFRILWIDARSAAGDTISVHIAAWAASVDLAGLAAAMPTGVSCAAVPERDTFWLPGLVVIAVVLRRADPAPARDSRAHASA
jgi:hypothetical protein